MTHFAQPSFQNGLPGTAKGRLELLVKNLDHVVTRELSEEQCHLLEGSLVLQMLDRGIGFLRAVQKTEGALRPMTVLEFLQLALRVAGLGKVSADMRVIDLLALLQDLLARHEQGSVKRPP